MKADKELDITSINPIQSNNCVSPTPAMPIILPNISSNGLQDE
ncbi:MAG: hypothetical protein RL766_2241, partial [Bacteroidota bacterium]